MKQSLRFTSAVAVAVIAAAAFVAYADEPSKAEKTGAAVGKAVGETADKVGTAVKETAQKVGEGAQKVGKKVGEVVATGAEKTGQALQTAGKKLESTARSSRDRHASADDSDKSNRTDKIGK